MFKKIVLSTIIINLSCMKIKLEKQEFTQNQIKTLVTNNKVIINSD
jgi:hypothetical protein